MKFTCFALVGCVGATSASASCDTPEEDVMSALQYAAKVKEHDMPMGGNTPAVDCPTCQGQEHNMEMTAPDSNLDGLWKCHNYQEGQNNAWCAETPTHEGFAMKFNGGDQTLTPGCGRCWCCTENGQVPGPPAPAAVVPPVFSGVVEHSDWKCHDYVTEGGNNEWCSGSPMNGPFQIRFTAGDDDLAPGCGDCWCCKRDTREKCPDWFGNIEMCGEQELQPMQDGTFPTCWGMGALSCTEAHLATACGSVDQACCADEDGSCADNDYSFACVKQAGAPTPTPAMTKPSPVPTPVIDAHVGVVVPEVSVAPAWMGAAPLCGNSELMPLNKGTTACWGSGNGPDWVRPCTEEQLGFCSEYGSGVCCSDEDGDCTNGSYSFSCLKK